MLSEDLSNDNEEQKYIQGELLYTIFRNESEHFTIAKFKVIATNEDFKEKEIVGKGYFSNLQEGTTYSFFGEFETHPKFGLQYNIHSYQTYIPDSKEGLIAYLSSDLFYGVGKKTAERIIDHLGETAISKILDNPELVNDIPGLKNETGKLLAETLRENQGVEHIVVYLSRYGIGLKLSQKIYEEYKEDAIEILEEDPYQYVFDIEGFGFQTADRIAQKNGLSLTHPNRIGAGCIYVLDQSIQNGHVYLPIDELIQQVIALLATEGLSAEKIINRLKELNTDKRVIVQEEKVYLPSLYYAEDGFSSHLKRIISQKIDEESTLADLLKIIGDIEETEALSYGKEQFSAIQKALHSKVMIVTGGPGTGKTTVIKGIINAYGAVHDLSTDVDDYENEGEYPFILTAPTGRAAKRLNESTGLPAVTIHRLLGWNGHDHFEKDEYEQLSGRLIIIDEFSMVDIWLANHLFKAIPSDTQVLLVGDEDQLPSVGPGQVLSDLLTSDLISLVSLNEVYRQKEGSKIIQLAHQIKNNTVTLNDLKNDQDFSFITCRENQVIEVITQIYLKAEKKGIDLRDIQVLAPMYRSNTGINEINRHLQAIVNPKKHGKREKRTKDAVFRVGDRVIQLVNQYEDGVSNGDIGEIVAIFKANENVDKKEEIVIAYDDLEVTYRRNEFQNITLAYCISIHKSQGSEFPIVILPIVPAYNRMLRKNLIYTAITRSQNSLIICGEKDAFFKGVETTETNLRYTSLKEQLQFKLSEEETMPTTDSEELSPYDFMD